MAETTISTASDAQLVPGLDGRLETAAVHATRDVPVAHPNEAVDAVLLGLRGRRFASVAVVAVCVDGRPSGLVTMERLLPAGVPGAITAGSAAQPATRPDHEQIAGAGRRGQRLAGLGHAQVTATGASSGKPSQTSPNAQSTMASALSRSRAIATAPHWLPEVGGGYAATTASGIP